MGEIFISGCHFTSVLDLIPKSSRNLLLFPQLKVYPSITRPSWRHVLRWWEKDSCWFFNQKQIDIPISASGANFHSGKWVVEILIWSQQRAWHGTQSQNITKAGKAQLKHRSFKCTSLLAWCYFNSPADTFELREQKKEWNKNQHELLAIVSLDMHLMLFLLFAAVRMTAEFLFSGKFHHELNAPLCLFSSTLRHRRFWWNRTPVQKCNNKNIVHVNGIGLNVTFRLYRHLLLTFPVFLLVHLEQAHFNGAYSLMLFIHGNTLLPFSSLLFVESTCVLCLLCDCDTPSPLLPAVGQLKVTFSAEMEVFYANERKQGNIKWKSILATTPSQAP